MTAGSNLSKPSPDSAALIKEIEIRIQIKINLK